MPALREAYVFPFFFGVFAGPVETEFGTHLIWVESCNKPENTWKKLYEDVVKKVSGKEDEK